MIENTVHLVIHSVLNRTGASRYLQEELLPGATGVLLLWTAPDQEPTGWKVVALRGRAAPPSQALRKGIWRISVFLGQALYLFRNRHAISRVEINSVSNLGAITVTWLLPRRISTRLHVHESPLGKWRWPFRIVKWLFRGEIHTVSPYAQSELRRFGMRADWAYPRAFSQPPREPGVDAPPRHDVLVIAHPDDSKGYRLLSEMLELLPRSTSVVVYLSVAPRTPLPKRDCTTYRIGRGITLADYDARICVHTTDPAFVKETFSYIVADAVAAGIPVVCSPSGGVSEQLIHGVNAMFCSSYDARAFARAIAWLLANDDMLGRLAAGARMVASTKCGLPSDLA